MTILLAESTEWWLELSSDVRAAAWQRQGYPTLGSRWEAYLNQICLNTFLPWFQAEYAAGATSWMDERELPSFWAVVNGSAIVFSGAATAAPTRLILIPSDAIADDALEVPQEWVDIPGWAGDYYLAVQLKPEEDWMRVWGYTTHAKLKATGHYDAGDRTYTIDPFDLCQDMNTFWVTHQTCSQLQTQVAVDELAAIAPTQAENLAQRLGNPVVVFPRLEVPFGTWGALLQQHDWRQRFYRARSQSATPQPAASQLSQWFRNTVETSWQTIEELFGDDVAFSFRSSARFSPRESIQRAQLIDLKVQGIQPVVLLVMLVPAPEDHVQVRVQLHPTPVNDHLPANYKLILLTETGEIIQEVQSREQDNYIQLPLFTAESGEFFSVRIDYGDARVIENFVV